MTSDCTRDRAVLEWPTLGLMGLCYGLWAACLWLPWTGPAILGIALAVTLHSSLQHEVIHGHPFRIRWLNEALVALPLGLLIPYARFRDTHLDHHVDARLTDPYDDPESNYMATPVWQGLPGWLRVVLRGNNTLLGRMLLGPLIAQVAFVISDASAILVGDRRVARGWLAHLPGLAVMGVILWIAPLPIWAYFVGAYLGHSILKIRTFAEHRAHEHLAARSVIIEDRGPLALLFLNNNLHVVHHMHPQVPWYRLPGLYGANRARYLTRNGGYRFASYGALFAQYLWRAKDPVDHPLWYRK